MPIVTTTLRDALRIKDPFLSDPVLLLVPDVDTVTTEDASTATKYVFRSVKRWLGITNSEDVTDVSGLELFSSLTRIISEELRDYTDISSDEIPGDDVKKIVDQYIPIVGGNAKLYNEKYTPGEAINITRLVVQSIFDGLSTYQTHLSVDVPVHHDIWDEGIAKPYSDFNIDTTSVNIDAVKVMTLHSAYFDQPVVAQTPSKKYMTVKQACKVTENVFSSVVDAVNLRRNGVFDGVETISFANSLHDTLLEHVETDLPNYGYENIDAGIQTAIEDTMPPTYEWKSLPNTINSPGVIIHVTRMALQTIFDNLTQMTTTFSVENPFKVREHKWNETIIDGVVEPTKGIPETDPDDGTWEKFDFENANIGDIVRISTVEDIRFTITDIGFNKRIPVRDDDDFIATEYLIIEPIDEDTIDPRYIVKNRSGVTSSRLMGENRMADSSTTGEVFLTVERLTTQDPLVTNDIKTKDRLTKQ